MIFFFILTGQIVHFLSFAGYTIVNYAPREKKVYFASVKFDARAKRGQ